MTGTRAVRATCQTIRKATGLMAGPDSPPVMLASRGRRVSISIAMPVIVLIRESASAPPASALRGDHSDVRDVRGELHDDRFARALPHRPDDPFGGHRVDPEDHPARLHVRAGDVYLHGRHPFDPIQPLGQCGVLLDARSVDVGDDRRGERAQKGHLVGRERIDAHVFQPDGVEHPAGGFDDARRRVALYRFERQALYDDGPEAVEVHQRFELARVTEGPGSGHDRVFEFQAGEGYAQVGGSGRHAHLLTIAGLQVKARTRPPDGANPLAARPEAVVISLEE